MKCPICGNPTVQSARPFCSKRCADLDLARWLNGTYAVPSNDPEDVDALEEALEEGQRKAAPDKPH
jgi:endogenous inhibitor of DNA gyrase (YacG/DUF329 family)